MVILDMADLLGKTEGSGDFQLHLRAVVRVPASTLGLPEGGHGEGIVPHQLLDILPDAVRIAVFLFLKGSAHLIAELKSDTLVDHGLTAQHVPVVLHRDVDVRKDFLVRLPAEAGTCLLSVGRLFFQAANVSALFKVQVVTKAVPADGGVKIFGSVLSGTGAKAVEAQRILVVFSVFAVLAAGVHFAEHQLPVIPLFLFVVIHGTAPAEVLHLHG